ncbi:DUF4352 domain-containing protein [Planosporangium sp. 12N6]|uniref:DUF4352 domain-containing protein n=1 Tax=Planosporangium spinosum TaxID=3402278 RepID=UPI003CF85764
MLVIGAVLAGLCCVGGLVAAAVKGAGDARLTSAVADTDPPPTRAQAHARLGQPARDGQFEFTVRSMACDRPTVGDQLFHKAAQGRFCLVTVDVRNVGTRPRSLSGGNQIATGPGRVAYRNDVLAELYANRNTKTFYENISPGNSVTGTLVFDIPTGARITALELHDSRFSRGVTVDVG